MGMPKLIERLLRLLHRRPPAGPDGAPAGVRMIGCHEALERLFEFLDGELDALETSEVEEHLRVCERCYPHLVFERSFRDAVRRALQGERAPGQVRARILEVLREEETAG